MKRGQTITEAILAIFIILMIATSATVAILGALSTSRLAAEQTQATTLAVEGLEAVKSIRDQNWNNLTVGPHGLIHSGNVWSFSGASDADASGRFVRTITIETVERDTDGNIVVSDGSIDLETVKATATIAWNFTSARQNSVVMALYLTNWQGGKGRALDTCAAYCVVLNYTTGQCRKGVSECVANGEVAENGGNPLCKIKTEGGTCCCR